MNLNLAVHQVSYFCPSIMAHSHKLCLVCSGERSTPIKDFSNHHLVKCTQCAFVYSVFIPSEKELTEYYTGYPVKSHRSPITTKRYNELLDRFEEFRLTGKILDIGCGTGYFLDEAQKRGWKVFGTEYSPESITNCRNRGISIHEGALDPSNYEREQFDVITSFEVIEHINDPLDEIEKIAQVLRKGGLFYVTTPNFNSLTKNLVGGTWNIVNYPEHLSYYTPKTMNRLLCSRGFKKKWVQTTGISISRFKSSAKMGMQENVDPKNDDEILRSKMETNPLLKFAKWGINGLLNLLGKGDALKAAYVKR